MGRSRAVKAVLAVVATVAALMLLLPSVPVAVASNADEPMVCDGCTPPLKNRGGPVMGTRGHPGEITITPIYWAPPGFSIPDDYTRIVNDYIANVAAASGSTDNVFSVDTEYSHINYLIHATPSMVDSTRLPSGCSPDPGNRGCFTWAEFRRKLIAFVRMQRFPADLAHFYPVFFPRGVQIAAEPNEKSGSAFCAFHSAERTARGTLVYAVEPYGNVCPNGQAPNGNAAADTQVDTLSHEIMESITDPTVDHAWLDSTGKNENGDMCNGNYGQPLGSTDPAHPATSRYTQVINGGKYYTQTDFSNRSYHAKALGGCVQSVEQAISRNQLATSTPGLNTVFVHAADHLLPADGTATSAITATVVDGSGSRVPGDDVVFRVASMRGSRGTCGALDQPEGTVNLTDGGGTVTVTYRASTDNVACDIVAIEGATGESDQVVVSQGTASRRAPSISTTFPGTLIAGGPAATFTATVSNHSSKAIANARIGIVISGGAVTASQLHVSFADRATHGRYRTVALTGGAAGGYIEGTVPFNGASFGAGKKEVVTFRITVDGGTGLHLETDLDQVNRGDGSTTTLDSMAGDVVIRAGP